MTNKKQNRILTLLIPLAGLLLLFVKDRINALTSYIPGCFVYNKLHLYCPACGNTRSVNALLQGDLIASLQYNITPGLVLLLAFLAYVEFAFASFGRPFRLLPRKLWFYLVLITLMVIYYITRNLSPSLAP
jgi:hypothetical protein